MIVINTSAIVAIALQDAAASDCAERVLAADVVLVSAGTVAEALIVAQGRQVAIEVSRLFDQQNVSIVSVTAASARRAVRAYAQWGKGVHPAGLNYGDCFAYELAMHHACPLLYVGSDFAKTDVKSAL